MGLGRELVDLLLPPVCALCDAGLPSGLACGAACRTCLAALPQPPEPAPEAPAPLAAWAFGAAYTGDARHWMRRFKYPQPGLAGIDPRADAVAEALVHVAAQRLGGPRPGLVVPVPAHPARTRRRGCDPPRALARALARGQGLAFDRRGLVRLRDTPSQTDLGVAARRANVAHAFGARRRLPPVVWVVDDVATTGATLAEAARAARAGGARVVAAVAAVHTPRMGAD